ncbi:hypothetical protein [Prevotella sp. HUN102]|uniref:hypothetical protein n=1 Tax=Prevotella sp. HUN102 TaxID=1392486 RepID=UPI00048C9CB3|nr:hypothetical protein [Prevotella sp. HUN102]
MKQFSKKQGRNFLFLLLGLLSFTGCNNDDDFKAKESTTASTYVDEATYRQVSTKIAELFNNELTTRSKNNISNEDAEAILSPLVPSGKMIVNDMILLSNSGKIDLTEEEIKDFKELTPEQLASIAFITHSLIEDPLINERQMSQAQTASIWDCVKEAFGFGDFIAIKNYIGGTVQLTKAVATKMIVKAVLRRAGAWITIAYSVYEFGKCMNGK